MKEGVDNSYTWTTGINQDYLGQTEASGYPTSKSPESLSVIPKCDLLLLQVSAWCIDMEKDVGSHPAFT